MERLWLLRFGQLSAGQSSRDRSVHGAGGGYAGLDQVNVLMPHGLIGKGEVPIVLTLTASRRTSLLQHSSNGGFRRTDRVEAR